MAEENEDIEKVEDDGEKKSLLANKKLLMIIAGVLLLIIIGVSVFLFLGSSDEETEQTESEETTQTEEMDDELPPEEQTDTTTGLELPEIPEPEPEPKKPMSASDRLSAISGGLTNPEPFFGGGDDDEKASTDEPKDKMEKADSAAMPEGSASDEGMMTEQEKMEEETPLDPISEIILEFPTPEAMATELAKLRRKVELTTKETTRLYLQLGDMEDKIREKERIIRAQDTAYLKGPKATIKRNTGPIAPPEPTWDVSPQHTGP